MDRGRRRRLRSGRTPASQTGRRRRSLRTRNNESVIELDDTQENGAGDASCIDLTSDNDTFIDLTTHTTSRGVNDSPVVVLDSPATRESRLPRRRMNLRPSVEIVSPIVDDIDDDEELPNIEFNIPASTPVASTSTGAATDDSILSPPRNLTCPVCLDSEKQIKKTGRKLMSTTCGHIFCAECIIGSIQANRKCPTCRKTLSKKQVHAIYL